MRTTVIINEEKLDRLMSRTGLRKKSEAIDTAVDHLLNSLAKKELLDQMGKLQIRDDWLKTRNMELEEK